MSDAPRQRRTKASPISAQMALPFPDAEQIQGQRETRAACIQCGRAFAAPVWYVRDGLRVIFCGDECRRAWEEGQEDNLLRPDGRPGHRGGDWENRARQVRERDLFACRGCGVAEERLGRQLHVHHLVPFRLFPAGADANRLDNLISLCPACHARIEAEGLQALPLFGRTRRWDELRIRMDREGADPDVTNGP